MLRVGLEEVLIPNARHLSDLLAASATSFELAMELVQNVRRSVVAEQFRAQLAQHLHNYTAAAYTLSEHLKTIMNVRRKRSKRIADPLAAPLAAKKAELLSSPEVEFAVQLRGFIQHVAHVPVTTSLSVDGVNTHERSFKSEIRLDARELQRGRRWEGEAQAFLAHREWVELRPVVDTYTSKLAVLYRWFIQQLIEEAEPLRGEHDQLIVEFNALLTGTDLEVARALTDETTKQRLSTAPPNWTRPTDNPPPLS
jgi:hypothetical protein